MSGCFSFECDPYYITNTRVSDILIREQGAEGASREMCLGS